MKGIESFITEHGSAIEVLVKRYMPTLEGILNEHGIQAVCDYVYGNIDNINEHVGINDKISCTKGCSICCNGNINLSTFEASYITSYIIHHKIEVDMHKVRSLAATKNIDKLKLGKKMCPLLDSEGCCKVYEVRPAICRVYNSTENPKYCDFDKYKRSTNTGRTLESFALMTALYMLDEKLGNVKKNENVYLHKALYETLS